MDAMYETIHQIVLPIFFSFAVALTCKHMHINKTISLKNVRIGCALALHAVVSSLLLFYISMLEQIQMISPKFFWNSVSTAGVRQGIWHLMTLRRKDDLSMNNPVDFHDSC